MLNINQLEQSIIKQCSEPDSFLVLLRENKFDDEKYRTLRYAIFDYHSAVLDNIMINRQVAGCLYLTMGVLEGAVIYHDREHIMSQDARKMREAYAELSDIVNDILSVST